LIPTITSYTHLIYLDRAMRSYAIPHFMASLHLTFAIAAYRGHSTNPRGG